MQNRFYDPAVGHIYIRGGGAPHTGVNLRDNRPCEANRERLSLSQHSPPQRSLAPIVNGLSTDVKLLFCRQIFCLSSGGSSALFRPLFSSGRNLEWDYARCHPIQFNPIQFCLLYKNTNGNGICGIFSEYRPSFGLFYSLFVIYIFLPDSGLLAGLNLQASTPPMLLRCVSIILQ